MTALIMALAVEQQDSGSAQVLGYLVQIPALREYVDIEDSQTATTKERRDQLLALSKRFTESVKAISRYPQGTIRAVIELIDHEENGDPADARSERSRAMARAQMQWLLGQEGSEKPVPKLGQSTELLIRAMFDCDVTEPRSAITTATSMFDFASLIHRGETFNRQDPIVFRDRYLTIDTRLASWGGAGSVPRGYLHGYDTYAKRFKMRDLGK